MSNVEERVKKIVVEQLDVSEDSVTNEASFVDDLGADSLDPLNWSWHSRKNSNAKFRTKRRKRSLPSSKRLTTSRRISARFYLHPGRGAGVS